MKRHTYLAVAMAGGLLWAPWALASPATTLDKCQKTVKSEGTKFVGGVLKAVGGCLKSVSTQIIGADTPLTTAYPSCVKAFRKLNSTEDPTKTVEARMRAKILLKCDPASDGVEHTLADILGPGAGVPQPLEAQNIGAWCVSLGGDGSIDSLNEWMDCLVAASSCGANQAIAAQYPRALEWFDMVAPGMAAIVPTPTDALTALAAVNTAIEGDIDDDVPDLVCGKSCGDGAASGIEQCDGADLDGATCASLGFGTGTLACNATCGFDAAACSGPLPAVCGDGIRHSYESCDGADLGGQSCGTQFGGYGTLACTASCGFDTSGCFPQAFPASGQTTCWNNTGSVIGCAGTGHDGEIRAGAVLAYLDNGDGTITDLNTRLMWEKQADNGDIHDWDNTYSWPDAFDVHVDGLNTASFGGHNDWRLPNRKELESILDLETSYPTVDAVFHTACAPACTVLTCSCTSNSDYWSSTNVSVLASGITFSEGWQVFHIKNQLKGVRAVRGGL